MKQKSYSQTFSCHFPKTVTRASTLDAANVSQFTLVVQGKELFPMVGEKKRGRRAIAQVMDMQRPIAFGIASNTSYWVACNQNDHTLHLYTSNGLGAWVDLGFLDIPC